MIRELVKMTGRQDWYEFLKSDPALKDLYKYVTTAGNHIKRRGETVIYFNDYITFYQMCDEYYFSYNYVRNVCKEQGLKPIIRSSIKYYKKDLVAEAFQKHNEMVAAAKAERQKEHARRKEARKSKEYVNVNEIEHCTDELSYNIIKHRQKSLEGKTFDIRVVICEGGQIDLIFKDAGRPFNPIINFDTDAASAIQNGEKAQLSLRVFNYFASNPEYRRLHSINFTRMTFPSN